MTSKERMMSAIQKKDVDRLPFWPKIFTPAYMNFQDEKFRSMGEIEMAEYLDIDLFSGVPSPVVSVNTRVEEKAEMKGNNRVVTYTTPDGVLTSVERYSEESFTYHPREFPIKDISDLKAARHVFSGIEYRHDDEILTRAKEKTAEINGYGVLSAGLGISPLMLLIQHWIGPDNTHYFLADYPDEMDELIGLMHEENKRRIEQIVSKTPCDIFVSVENTSTQLLSPHLFKRYCWQHLNDYAKIVKLHGKYHILHMCGHLKALLEEIDELPSDGIEAFTTPPVGDATVKDGFELCPTKSLIGGTNAALWIRSVDEICQGIEKALEAAGGARGLILTSGGVMPWQASIEKIRSVRSFLLSLS